MNKIKQFLEWLEWELNFKPYSRKFDRFLKSGGKIDDLTLKQTK